MTGSEKEILGLLNAQTGRLAWSELARHFARGVVICIEPGQDLVGIAGLLVQDDSTALESLVTTGLVRRASDDDARRWQQDETTFWAVVVAPWVLVQEI